MADKSAYLHDDPSVLGSVRLNGMVDKIIPAIPPSGPSTVQIVVSEADELYREIRIPNVLHNGNGTIALCRECDVEITVTFRTSKGQPFNRSLRRSAR